MANNAKRTSRPVSSGRSSGRAAKKPLPIGLIIVGGGAVIVLLLVVLLVMANRPQPVDTAQYESVPVEWINGRNLGSPDAPIVVETYEDFLCPACSSWATQIKPQLMEYVNDGTVRIQYNFFPLTTHEPGATLSAQAAQCAADQGAFWPYHDQLFANTNNGQSAFTIERLGTYAASLGLNEQQLTSCVINQENFNEVQASLSQAIGLGLNSTPSVLLNGELLQNPFDMNTIGNRIRQSAGSGE